MLSLPSWLKVLPLLGVAFPLCAASTAVDLDQPFFRNSPKDLAMIPGSARWAAYLDLSDPKQAELGRGLFRNSVLPSIEVDAETGSQMRQAANELTSITVYGGSLARTAPEGSPVAILEGRPPLSEHVRAALRARIKASPGSVVATVASLSVEGYAVRAPREPAAEPVYLAFPSDAHFVVVSKSIPELQEALLAPARRQHPAAAAAGSSVNTLLARQGNYLLRAAIETPQDDEQDPDANSQLLKLTHTAKLFVSLDGSRVHASLHVQAPDPQTAARLTQIMQGLIAMYAVSGRNGDWSQLLASASVRAEGSFAIVDADYPVARLLALAAQRQARSPSGGFIGLDAYGRQVGSSRTAPSTLTHAAGERQTHVFAHVALDPGEVITIAGRSRDPSTRAVTSVELVPEGDNGTNQVYVPMALVPGSDSNGSDSALYQGTFTGAAGRYDLVFLTLPDEVGPVAFDVRVGDPADRNP